MTYEDLEEYKHLKNEIISLNGSLSRLSESAYASIISPEEDTESPKTIQRMNHQHVVIFSSREQRLRQRLVELQSQIQEIDQFIHSIHKSEIRQIVELRYIEGDSWVEIAKKLYTSTTPATPQMALKRYLKKYGQQYEQRRKTNKGTNLAEPQLNYAYRGQPQ